MKNGKNLCKLLLALITVLTTIVVPLNINGTFAIVENA